MTGFQAIVLAAGAGERFGGGKLLADWRGQPLIAAAAHSALAAPVDEVIIVLGCDAEAVSTALRPLWGDRLRFVVAEDWKIGLAASLRAGVRALPPDSRGFLLFLGDMPLTPPDVASRALAALTDGAVAAQPFREDVPAHPVGFSRDLYNDLLQLSGDSGAAALLRRIPDVLRFQTEARGAVLDIDRPGDLEHPGGLSPPILVARLGPP